MSSYFVNDSLACYNDSVPDSGGGGDGGRDYAASAYRGYSCSVTSPGPYGAYGCVSSGQNGDDYYSMSGHHPHHPLQRLSHHPSLAERYRERSPPGGGGKAPGVPHGASSSSPYSGHGGGSGMNTYSPSSGSETSNPGDHPSAAGKASPPTPPPAHSGPHPRLPPLASPIKSAPAPRSSSPLGQQPTAASSPPKTAVSSPVGESRASPPAGTPSEGQDGGGPGSPDSGAESKDGDVKEEGQTQLPTQHQIYPWMKRMHVGHGKERNRLGKFL